MIVVQFLGGDRFNDWVWDMLKDLRIGVKITTVCGIKPRPEWDGKWLEQDGYLIVCGLRKEL